MNANTLEDSVDQYDSMVKEKALADANRRDPRWLNVFPSSRAGHPAPAVAGGPDLPARRDELRAAVARSSAPRPSPARVP